MVPQTQKRRPKNSSKVNLMISLAFHALLVGSLVYFAAREGLLGKKLRKIAVEMVKEKPPEKPKEPVKPKEEPPKVETPKVAQAPKEEPPKEVPPAAPPPTVAAPPAVAPPATEVASFSFDGGRAVETSSDPIQIYKSLVEYTLRSGWDRPGDIDDHSLVAELEVSVDHAGHISDPEWVKHSGNNRWDTSVLKAVDDARNVSRPPPAKFPGRFMVRFDVVPMETVGQ